MVYPIQVWNYVHSLVLNSSNESMRINSLKLLRHLIGSNQTSRVLLLVDQSDSIISLLTNLILHPFSGRFLSKKMSKILIGSPLAPVDGTHLFGEVTNGSHLSKAIVCELVELILTLGSSEYLKADRVQTFILIEFLMRQLIRPNCNEGEKVMNYN